ncbi:MAG: hypothetical protein ACLS3C_11035 [Oscillospiraceae bacterium]
MRYKELTFNVKPMNFKHTGVFPEQASTGLCDGKSETQDGRSVLNLFAYTGERDDCLRGGRCERLPYAWTRQKGMVAWARKTQDAGLEEKPIRWSSTTAAPL